MPASAAVLPRDVWVLGPNAHPRLAWQVRATDSQIAGDQGCRLSERRILGGQELGLTFGSNNPVAREI